MKLYLSLSSFSPLIAVAIGVIYRKRNLLWYYAITDSFFDFGITLLREFNVVDVTPVGNLFFPVEFLFFAFAFRKRIFPNDWWFWSTVTGLCGSYLFYTSVIHSPFEFQLKASAVFFSIPYIVLSILGYYTIIQRIPGSAGLLERSSFFWFNTAVLLYASGSIVLFLFYDYFTSTNQRAQFMGLWRNVFVTMNITKNLLLAPAVYFYNKQEYQKR